MRLERYSQSGSPLFASIQDPDHAKSYTLDLVKKQYAESTAIALAAPLLALATYIRNPAAVRHSGKSVHIYH